MEKLKKVRSEPCFDADIFICLLVLEAMAVYYYGLRAFVTAAVLTAVSVVCNAAVCRLRCIPADTDSSFSAAVSGIMLALMLPASVPIYIAVICGIFSELIVIQAFGGHGSEIFCGAAAGYLMGEICFPNDVLEYPAVLRDRLSLSAPDNLSVSFSRTMLTADTSPISDLEVILGRNFSPMGTGVIVLLAVIAVYLMFKRKISFEVFLIQTAVYGGFSAVSGSGLFEAKYNLLSGMYLFVSIFAICAVIPESISKRIIYGIFSGVLICLFRYYSLQENPAVYASVISAAFCGILKQREENINGGNTENDGQAKSADSI